MKIRLSTTIKRPILGRSSPLFQQAKLLHVLHPNQPSKDPFLENPNNTCKQAQKAVVVYIQGRGFIGVATTLYQLTTQNGL